MHGAVVTEFGDATGSLGGEHFGAGKVRENIVLDLGSSVVRAEDDIALARFQPGLMHRAEAKNAVEV